MLSAVLLPAVLRPTVVQFRLLAPLSIASQPTKFNTKKKLKDSKRGPAFASLTFILPSNKSALQMYPLCPMHVQMAPTPNPPMLL